MKCHAGSSNIAAHSRSWLSGVGACRAARLSCTKSVTRGGCHILSAMRRVTGILVVAACGSGAPPAPTPVASPVSPPVAAAAPPTATTPPAPPTPAVPRAPTGADILLAVTGLTATADDIALDQLRTDYCAGNVAVVTEVAAAADARFKCQSPAAARTSFAAFVPQAKTAVLVTDLDHVTSQLKALTVDGISAFARPHDYPLVAPNVELAGHFTDFIVTGTTAITRNTGLACEDHGVPWLTEKLRPALAGADYIHVSNEVSFTKDCSYGSDHPYQFCSRLGDFQALVDLGVNVVELTGNHNRDFGDAAFRNTYFWYAAHGMATFGAGLDPVQANLPIVLPLADGKRLGIIGFNEWCPLHECAKVKDEVGANAYSDDKAFADLAALRSDYGADIVMATVQFHESEHHKPLDSQARIARALIDHGADIVSGSQAHQLQWVEFYKGKPIYFGIGNFLFDQVYKTEVRQAFFVHHYFFQGRLVQSVPVFTFMAGDRQPTLATKEQAAAMKALSYRDELLYTP